MPFPFSRAYAISDRVLPQRVMTGNLLGKAYLSRFIQRYA